MAGRLFRGGVPTDPEVKALVRQRRRMMRLVVIESPYAGNVEDNERYARACMADSLARGEAPFASHLLYTQQGVLDDTSPAERDLGMRAGFAWGVGADAVAVYTDRGISAGMRAGIERAEAIGLPIEYRRLDERKVGR